MSTGVFVQEEQRNILEGLGEDILNLVAFQENLPVEVWGDWLSVPFERAAAYGNVDLATDLLRAGAKGFGLLQAARNGHRRVVCELLQLGASPDAKDGTGNAAIHVAAGLGHGPIVKTLLIEGAEKDLVDGKGRTPLHLASIRGDASSVKALLAAGADVSIRFSNGDDDMTALDAAAWKGQVGVMRLLVERGAMANAVGGVFHTVLHIAADYDQVAAIDFLVKEAASNINAMNAQGFTPLLCATLYGHASAVDALCVLGADLSIRAQMNLCSEERDLAALDVAAFYGYVEIMKTLLKHGSDVNALGLGHQSALNMAAEGNQAGAIDVLMEAGAVVHIHPGFDGPFQRALEGDAREAIRALARHGIDPDWHEGHGQTSLLRAVGWRDLEMVNALLAAGANPNVSGSSESVLFASLDCDIHSVFNSHVFRALLDHGANVDARNDDDGQTALHAAAAWCNGFAVGRLVKAGANVNAKSRKGLTPLHGACSAQNRNTIISLLKHGAEINSRDDDGDSPLHMASLASEHPDRSLELVDYLLIAGADETARNNSGNTPASHLLGEPNPGSFEPEGVLREQIRELLVRAPADRADRAWRRRGMLLVCRRYFDKQVRQEPERSRTTKSPRMTDGGDTADGTNGKGVGGAHESTGTGSFDGMVTNLFELRNGKEEIFRKIMYYL